MCACVYSMYRYIVYNLGYLFILENFHYVFAIPSSSLKLQVNKLNVDFVANKVHKSICCFSTFFFSFSLQEIVLLKVKFEAE